MRRIAAALLFVLLAGVPARGESPPRRRRDLVALAQAEGVALGLLVAGGGVAWATRFDAGAAPVYAPAMAAGAILTVGTLAAALLDVVLPAARSPAGAAPPRRLALALGWRFIRQRPLAVTGAAGGAVDLRAGPLAARFAGEGGAGYTRAAAAASWRLPLGLGAGRELRLGVLAERTALAEVASTPAAAWVEARWGLGGALARLPRPWARLRLGGGIERVRAGAADGADSRPLLVADGELGFGVGPVDLRLGYDHRKDAVPGGLYLGKAPGFLGSVGIAARVPLGADLALAAEARLGTGVTTWLGIEWSPR